MAREEDGAATINVTQPRKGLGDGWQDDVEAANKELAHHHGHDDSEYEANLGEPAREDGWALAAETLEVCLGEAFVGVIVGGAEGVRG
ncbi:hypothetical protein MferCBS31731_000307 [Microsporum ferrugineum]